MIKLNNQVPILNELMYFRRNYGEHSVYHDRNQSDETLRNYHYGAPIASSIPFNCFFPH